MAAEHEGHHCHSVAAAGGDQPPRHHLRDESRPRSRLRSHRYPGKNLVFTAISAVKAVTTAR